MLTADLVQATVRGGVVLPRYIDPENEATRKLADDLIALFSGSAGESRRHLDTQLRDLLGTGTAFLLHRGLAKLLLDRCEFETSTRHDPVELRRAVFEEAALAHRRACTESFSSTGVLAKVAERLDIPAGEIERSLYADLAEEQILVRFDAPRSDWLLDRYNLALAQAVLLRANELEIEVPPQKPSLYRELFRRIKFFQLLHRVEGTAAGGYRLKLDGPLSLFKSSQRYGLQMASFLPSVLHLETFRLEARVLWGKERTERKFVLTPENGLRPHTFARGQWQPEEMGWLPEQFGKLETPWEISTATAIVDLGGQGVLIPDYVFTHRGDATEVYLEILGFWRRGAVASRLELLRRHGPRNLILGLARQLHAGEDALEDLPGELYIFRNAPVAREIAKILERYET